MARKKKEVHTGKLAIRHKVNGFSTIIPADQFMAHDENFRDDWDVLNEFPEQEQFEDEADEAYDEAEAYISDDDKQDPVT
jgi:hypothetical protein